MGGNLVIDVDDCFLKVALEDTGVILRETVDVTDADSVVFLFLLTICESVN